MEIAGLVIFFNPDTDVLNIIDSYIDEIDKLLIIDNSLQDNSAIINNYPKKSKIIYKPMLKNLGLASALKKGVNYLGKTYSNILLLDQDTLFEKGTINSMKQALDNGYAIVCPNMKMIIQDKHKKIIVDKPVYSLNNHFTDFCITSGSLISYTDFLEVGGFDDNLFIGQIDQEYCCKLKKHHKKIYRLGKVFMYQEAGNPTMKKLFGHRILVPNYNPVRYYYYCRNEIYLRLKYKKEYREFRVELFKYVIMIVLYEKQKFNKILFMIKGYIDGINLYKNINKSHNI